MGLDLYHLKATLDLEASAASWTFREDEFDTTTLDTLGFRRFVLPIPDIAWLTRIVILKDDSILDLVQSRFPKLIDPKDVSILVGEPCELSSCVERIERERGLDPWECILRITSHGMTDGLEYQHDHGEQANPLSGWTWSKVEALSRGMPDEKRPLLDLLHLDYPIFGEYPTIHAAEIGHQVGGMSQDFYEAFAYDGRFFRRDDVLRAMPFLKLSGVADEDRCRHDAFRRNFLADFEEGVSIFLVSY